MELSNPLPLFLGLGLLLCFFGLLGPRMLECDGRTEVDRLTEEFGVPIPAGDYETVSGYVLARVRAIPKLGDQLELGEHFTIIISQADSRQIQRLRIQSSDRDFLPEPGGHSRGV